MRTSQSQTFVLRAVGLADIPSNPVNSGYRGGKTLPYVLFDELGFYKPLGSFQIWTAKCLLSAWLRRAPNAPRRAVRSRLVTAL